MQMLRVFVVENERTARRFLREAGIETDFSEIEMLVLNEHTPANDIESLLQPCRMGRDMGLLSESGLPCLADPGARLVLIARQEGIEIIPLSGPSSVILALISSGLNGQSFTFHGYLPIDKSLLARKIKEIERKARTDGQTQIFIETPYRNDKLFEAIKKTCLPDTLLSIATEITSPDYYQDTFSINEWKHVEPEIHKKNSVFLLGYKYW
jgi:16S rRNA (cytidine1402-2'-O)-methyltransferase